MDSKEQKSKKTTNTTAMNTPLKPLLSLLLIVSTLSACAQKDKYLDQFYQKYSTDDAVKGTISVNPSLWLNASFSGDSNKNWIDKLSVVRLLIIDGKKTPGVQEDVESLSKQMHGDNFDDLLTVSKGKQKIQLLSKDLQDGVKDVVFLIRGDDDGTIFVQLKGKLSAKDLSQMESSFNDDHQ
jgi:hypothetical protein